MRLITIIEVFKPELHYDVEIDNSFIAIGLGYEDAVCLAFNRITEDSEVMEVFANGRVHTWQKDDLRYASDLALLQLTAASAALRS